MENGGVSGDSLQVILRDTGHHDMYREVVRRKGIDNIVRVEKSLPYLPALKEMLSADGLVIFQSPGCNHQIPAKLYEYLRARRPILALTDEAGDTARTLRSAGVGTVAPLESKDEIAASLMSFLKLVREKKAPVAEGEVVRKYSREARTAELARLLDTVSEQSA